MSSCFVLFLFQFIEQDNTAHFDQTYTYNLNPAKLIM